MPLEHLDSAKQLQDVRNEQKTPKNFNKRSNSVAARSKIVLALAKQKEQQKMYLDTKYLNQTYLHQFPLPPALTKTANRFTRDDKKQTTKRDLKELIVNDNRQIAVDIG
jgi:hypothetical protein